MTTFFKFLGDNAIASAIVAAIVTASILGGVAWLRRKYPDRRDSKIIYDFLLA